MSFSESGVYKITWNKLREFGFDPSDIDPKNIAIYGQNGGMLAQSLSENRYIDLQENPITVVGESDGVFGENDYILFYVDEINQVDYDANSDQFNITRNLYTDEIFYFLTIKNEPDLG